VGEKKVPPCKAIILLVKHQRKVRILGNAEGGTHGLSEKKEEIKVNSTEPKQNRIDLCIGPKEVIAKTKK